MEQGKEEGDPPPPPLSDGQMMANSRNRAPPFQKCPRCDSGNTKFCYYNNYSLSQPRYFCKACRRYWTQGGTLRNVPIGGGCRKAKRPKPSSSSSSSSSLSGLNIPGHPFRAPPAMNPIGNNNNNINPFYNGGGAFMSSLAAMQSHMPAGTVFQMPPLNIGSSHFGANMGLLPPMTPPSFKPPPPPPPPLQQGPPQFLAQNDPFLPRQSLMIPPQRPAAFGSWNERFTNRGAVVPTFDSSDASSSFWSNAADGSITQASSSFDPNQWSDDPPVFDPSL